LGKSPNVSPPSDGVPRAPLPILVIGKRMTGEAIRRILTSDAGSAQGQDGLHAAAFVVEMLTSQKAALGAIRKSPPRLVMVELDRGPHSRQRFCTILRYRLPAAGIYAIGHAAPTGTFVFDGVLHLPLRTEEVWQAAQSVQAEVGDNMMQRGPLRLDLAARLVIGPNGPRHLTPKQCALLHYLMIHTGDVVGRAAIMAAVWQTDYIGDTRTLDVHIRWLRECIEPDPSTPVYLVTVRGQGYLLKV
jgi:DNA-binding response OmpR family regulator